MITPAKNDRMNPPPNQFGLTDIAVKVVSKRKGSQKNAQNAQVIKKPEEKVDQREIGFNNQILEVNKALEDLRQSMSIIEEKFFSSLDVVILIYPFDKIEDFYKTRLSTIREDSFSTLLGSLDRFCNKIVTISQTEVEAADSSNLSVIEKQFFEVKSTKSEIYNDFSTFQTYLQIFKDLLIQSTKEVALSQGFMQNLFNAGTTLLKKTISQSLEESLEIHNELAKQGDFCDKVENLAHNMSKLLLTCSMCKQLQGKEPEDDLKALNRWLATVFEVDKYIEEIFKRSIVSQDHVLFKDLMDLLQFSSSFDVSLDTLLVGENPVLKALLSKENNIPWNMSTVSSIAFVLNNILRGSISEEISIELSVKKALLNGPIELASLLEHRSFTEQKDQQNLETLASVLRSKFRVSLDSQSKDQRLYISIDWTKEKGSPIYEIERVITNLSDNAKRLLDLLATSLINNFIFNLSQASYVQNGNSFKGAKYRETTSMLTMISLLIHKHPQLLVYLAFKKNDYTPLIKSNSSNSPFLRELNSEDFRSITFVECLFKTKYFVFHSQDMFLLIKVIETGIGVTFINSEDPEVVLDIAHIILNSFTQLMIQDLEKRCKKANSDVFESIEGYLCLNACVNLLIYFWAHVQKSAKIVFEKYFQNQLLLLLNKILQGIKLIPEHFYKALKSCENTQNLLAIFLNEHYQGQIGSLSIPEEMLNQARHHSYNEFINPVNYNDDPKTINIFENHLRTLEIQPESSHKEKGQNIRDPQIQEKTLETSINANTIISFKQTWAENQRQTISEIRKIIPSKGDAKANMSRDSKENKLLQNFANYLECTRFNLGKEDKYVCSSPDLLIVKCTPILDFNLTPQISPPVLDTKPLNVLLYEKISKDTNLNQGKQDFKVTADKRDMSIADSIRTGKTSTSIKYFFHSNIEDQADFESLERHILIKLKIVSEQVSVLSSSMSSQTPRENVVAKELAEHQKQMSEFEKNLLLCHVSQFETFKSFEYPDNISEIRAELSWIKENFSEYINILNKMRGSKNKNQKAKGPEKVCPVSYEPINPNEYQLCADYLAASDQAAISELTNMISQNSSLFRELYPVNDELVQSLSSFFYIKYEKDLNTSNPATLELLGQLCNSANFEVKLLDFCMFFLYCPEHLETISADKSTYKYPYSTILNVEKGQLIFNQVYNVVAFNILIFLKNHLSKRDYLLYQPRLYLEKYGLQSLSELKAKANYRQKTSNMVSFCDLLVGLQVVPQITQNTQLSREVSNIIFGVFSKERNFNIVEYRETEELPEKTNLLTSKSCHTLLKINKIELILRYIPNIMFYSFKEVTHIIENLFETLYKPVEEISLVLKSRPHNEQAKNIQVSKIIQLNDLQPIIEILVEIFSSVSSIMSTKLVKDEKNTQSYFNGKPQQENDHIQGEAIKVLGNRILHKKSIRKLIKQIFGILNHLPNLDPTLCTSPLTVALTKICLNFYALICIEQDYMQSELLLTDEFSPFKASESPTAKSIKASNHSPMSLIKEALSSQKYRGLVFGLHVINMCSKYRTLIIALLGESTKEKAQGNGISVIWRHHPKLLDLMTKKKFLMDKISPQALGARNISIDRKDLIKTTLQEFSNKPLYVLRLGVQVMFAGESGLDIGGLTREFLTIITKELFDPNKGLFQFAENSANIQPSPASQITPLHLKYFELAGIMLAKVIQEDCVVDINLTKPLLNHILKRNVTLDDLADIDSHLAKSLKWMLSHSAEGLEQYFTYETRLFGQNITRELITNGHKILVTDENKTEFVRRICQVKMRDEIGEQLAAFLRGFHLIIPAEYLALFNASELQAIIAGDPEIDADEILNHANYKGYETDPDALIWLMEVLKELTQEELTAFVFFVTGSLRLPSRSLSEWTLTFKKGGHGANKLPLAHTCSWLIEIPHYTSKAELKQKLLQAIFEGQGSFMRR